MLALAACSYACLFMLTCAIPMGSITSFAWKARWTVAATSHPASGDAIPPPFRIAAWPFMGSVPCTALAFVSVFFLRVCGVDDGVQCDFDI